MTKPKSTKASPPKPSKPMLPQSGGSYTNDPDAGLIRQSAHIEEH